MIANNACNAGSPERRFALFWRVGCEDCREREALD